MISIHIEASTIAELRRVACAALDLHMHRHGDVVSVLPERSSTEPQGEPVQSDKPRRAHRRVRPVEAPVAPPVAALELEPDPLEEAFGVLTAEVDASDVELDALEPADAVSNELLKREVIASLSDMFTAGNVKVVRHVLHKYGRGAKSFPEIDPAHFPEIKAALDRNEAA